MRKSQIAMLSALGAVVFGMVVFLAFVRVALSQSGAVRRLGDATTGSLDLRGFDGIVAGGNWHVTLVRSPDWSVEVRYPEGLADDVDVHVSGFGASGVVVSVLTEALLPASLGGLAGVTVAWAFLDGGTFSLGYDEVGSFAVRLKVTPELLVIGLVWACAVGLLGGLFPAIRSARLPVATALRAV